MNWKALKEFRCPMCFSILKENTMYCCIGCDFKISKGKLVNIIGEVPVNWDKAASKLIRYTKRRQESFRKNKNLRLGISGIYKLGGKMGGSFGSKGNR